MVWENIFTESEREHSLSLRRSREHFISLPGIVLGLTLRQCCIFFVSIYLKIVEGSREEKQEIETNLTTVSMAANWNTASNA